jgi:hypothetical protein
MALAIAFIRGIARREQKTIGNFWVDMTARHAVDAGSAVPVRRAADGVTGCGAELEAV